VTDVAVDSPDVEFSLVDDPPLRLQRALRIAPRAGYGAGRRSVLFVLVTWAPVIVWAAARGLLGPELWGEHAIRHLGFHVRCLLAIPLLVLSGPLAARMLAAMVANFVHSGLVGQEQRAGFTQALRSVERLRDNVLIWIGIAVAVVAIAVAGGHQALNEDPDAVRWTAAGTADFGALWSVYVSRPVVALLVVAWLWRLFMTWLLLRRIARLGLRLVPSHPDGVGGLGFLEYLPGGFSLVIFAISSVSCATIAHRILEHGARLAQFQGPLIVLAVLLALLFMAPLIAFSKSLRRIRIRARFQYGTLAGLHVRGLHERWIEGTTPENEAVLQAPEIGPAADVATLYQMATKIRPVPIGKATLGIVLVPALLPMLLVASLEVSLLDMLVKVLGMLK